MPARLALPLLVLVALALRLHQLDSPLWLDEIATWQTYGPMTVGEVFSSYAGSNNHLLNTLLMKASAAVFGPSEWALRLPALLFGVAGIPAMYLCARTALSERAAVSAAALLSVASHHVFFSQNARGYTAWPTLSLLASALLARAVDGNGGPRAWWLWVLASIGNVASLLLSAFVVVAHGLAGAVAVVRTGTPSLARKLAIGFTLIGLGGLLLYAWVVPDVLAYVDTEYRKADAGYSLLSMAFVQEVVRGLGLALVAAPIGALWGYLGVRALWRRSPTLTVALLAGPVIQAVVVVALGLSVVPRHFLLTMPLGLLVLIAGVEVVATRWNMATQALLALVLLLGGLSGVQLQDYYAHPKQDIPGALAWIARERAPDQRVIALHLAEVPVDYYGPRYGITRETGASFVRTEEALDAALEHPGTRPGYLVMTLPRALHIALPDLAARVERDWELVQTFPGTLGDADVTVWLER